MNDTALAPSADPKSLARAQRARRRKLLFVLGLLIGIVGGYFALRAMGIGFTLKRNANRQSQQVAPPPGHAWAAKLDRPGLPNLHRVSDTLYRGARPKRDGYAELKALGVRTVVNLEKYHNDADESAAAGLANERIKTDTWAVSDEHVVRFLKIVGDPARTPVFVHCQHGSDRTGTMCAMYRIFIDGWPKDAALDEMKKGGFGYHEMWENLETYIRNMDVDAIRKKAGLPAPTTQPDT